MAKMCEEMLRGYIFHLPSKEQIGAIQLHDFRIDDGCFGHPVLILDTTQHAETVKVLIVSQTET
jgi:hypothetical protein